MTTPLIKTKSVVYDNRRQNWTEIECMTPIREQYKLFLPSDAVIVIAGKRYVTKFEVEIELSQTENELPTT